MNLKLFPKNSIKIFTIIFVTTSITQTNECPNENQQILKFDPNADIVTNLPPNFRTMQDVAKLKFQNQSDKLTEGLEELNASGSAQFYPEVISNMVLNLRQKGAHDIIIVDVREESHMYVNNIPFAWYQKPIDHFTFARYNLNKSSADVQKDEVQKIAALKSEKNVKVYGFHPNDEEKKGWPDIIDCKIYSYPIVTITSEKDLVNSHGLHYARIPITDDSGPSIRAVDEFLSLFKEHKDSWLHIHCEAGEGRTTTALAFFDMFYNAKKVDFETIAKRQSLLGNHNLLLIRQSTPSHQKADLDRLETLKSFYQYCKNNNDDYKTTYSVWLKSQQK